MVQPPAEDEEVQADLAAAERAGLRLYLRGRQAVLGVAAVWFTYGLVAYFPINGLALSLVAGLWPVGFVQGRSIGTAAERRWHKFAFFALDVAVLGLTAGFAPLTSGGDVP